MLSPIKTQNTGMSYQNAVNKNKTPAASGISFSEALSQSADSDTAKSALTKTDLLNIIQEKIHEMQDKLENGETESTFQIGGQTFTEKELKKLIHKVDRALEQDKDTKKAENESNKKNITATTPDDRIKPVKRVDETELDSLISLLLHEE